MQEIAPGIFIEQRYPPYTLGLIQTDYGALAVDIPPHPEEALRWQEEAEQVVGPLRYAVLTDAQPERLFAATHWRVPLIAGEGFARRLKTFDERGWQEFMLAMAQRYPGQDPPLLGRKPRRPTLGVHQRFALHYRPLPLEFFGVEGCGPAALWLYLPDEGLLFAGDTVVLDEPPPLEHTPDSRNLLNTLGNLAGRTTVQRIVPGRGPAVVGRGELEPLREYLRVARRTARTLARHASSADFQNTAQDLQQAFFAERPQTIQRVRLGLERLAAEVIEATAAAEAAKASAAEAEAEATAETATEEGTVEG